MKKVLPLLLLVIFACERAPKKIIYPETRKDNVEEDYFGTKVKDPYRWLENDHSEETKKWVDKQIAVTQSYLNKIPFRGKIKKRFESLMKYPREGAPFKRGDYYFVYKNNGSQNQSVLYIKKNIEDKEEEILNPNTMSDEGIISLNGFNLSP